jgi:hypothetical protein
LASLNSFLARDDNDGAREVGNRNHERAAIYARRVDPPTRPPDPLSNGKSPNDATGLADLTCRGIEIILGINPDFRRPASFAATGVGAVHAAGA